MRFAWLKSIGAVFLGFLGLFFLLFSPTLLSGNLLAPGDAWYQSVPAYFSPPELWSTLLLGGFPVAADPQVQTWYPLRYLFGPTATGFNLYVTSAYVLSACFAFGCVRSIAGTTAGAVLGAIIYSMNGFAISNMCHVPLIHAYAFLPLSIWALTELKRELSGKWFAIGVLAVALMVLAGHPQTLLYSTYVIGAYVICNAIVLGKRTGIKYASLCAIVLLLGIACGAVQLIPTFELSSFSTRSSLAFGSFCSYNLTPLQSASMIFPTLFGSAAEYFGEWNFQSTAGFVGYMSLLLSALAVFSRWRHRAVWFWLAIAGLAFLLTLGDGCVLSVFSFYLPGHSYFRCPSRHFMEMALALSILAGLGYTIVEDRELTEETTGGALLVLWGLALLAFLSAHSNASQIEKLMYAANPNVGSSYGLAVLPLLVPAVLMVVSSLALVSCHHSQFLRFARFVLPLLIVVELSSFAVACPWMIDSKPAESLEAPPRFSSSSHARKELLKSGQRLLCLRGIDASREEMPPNLNRIWRISSATGYEPLISRRYFNLMSITPGGMLSKPPAAPALNLDLMCVRFIVAPVLQESDAASTIVDSFAYNPSRWSKVFTDRDVTIYENPQAMPRAWFVDEVVIARPFQILSTILDGKSKKGIALDLHKTALVEGSIKFNRKATQPGSVRIDSISSTEMKLSTSSSTDEFLVIGDVYYPGWSATVDGKPTPVFQTNYVLRGIKIPGGNHSITLRYRPESLKWASIISALALVATIVIAWLLTRRTARTEQTEGERNSSDQS